MTTTEMSPTLVRIDRVVRELHEEREGHTAEGHWTERACARGRMMPRQFVPTCCGKR